MTHEEIKAEVVAAAKAASACADQYRKAAQSTTHEELSAIMRNNFHWLVNNKVLTGETIDRWKPVGIVHNQNVSDGFCYASGSSTVDAFGSSTVRAFGSSTVRAFGSSTVRASDSSTVEAFDSSTVEAFDSSTVEAFGSSTVRAFGSSTVRAFGSSTVRAFDSSYVNTHSTIECALSGRAIARVNDTTIKTADGKSITIS